MNENIEEFISNHSHDIIELCDDLKNRFPYFLDKLNSADLLIFILDSYFTISDNKSNLKNSKFLQEYENEIYTTLNIIKTSFYKIKEKQWLEFCFTYTSY